MRLEDYTVRRIIVKSTVLSLILIVVGAQPALAYIDPNTGGMLFQILAVAFASISAVLLIFSRQVRTVFARIRRGLRGLLWESSEVVQGDGGSTAPVQDSQEPAEPPEPPE